MDRIIVRTNADMQRVLNWSEKLRGMTLELPFPEGEIEFLEEMILLKFWDEGNCIVGMELWIRRRVDEEYLKVAGWRWDATTGEYPELQIAGDPEKKLKLGMLLATDNTVAKCVGKFVAIMLFSAYYREDIQRTKTVSRTSVGTKKPKKGKKSSRRMLTIRRYTIGSEMLSELPAPKREWHGYAESFGVRGHYRHYKNGKVVWVRPYTKKGRMDKKSDREYIL